MSDPVLTQNAKKADRAGREQRKFFRANRAEKRKSEPKRLRFCFETTYGSEDRGGESLTAYHREPIDFNGFAVFILSQNQLYTPFSNIFLTSLMQAHCHLICNTLLSGYIQMPVNISSCLNVAVSHPLLYIFQPAAVIQQQACTAVTQFMKTDMRQSVFFKYL